MQEKRAPINTTQRAIDDPFSALVSAMVGNDTSNQRIEGQESFLSSDTLPTDISGGRGYDAVAILEAAGVKFLGVVEGDSIFQFVELPEGWVKCDTNHYLWSELIDEKGRKRATIFYKAAIYDRSAHMALCNRYAVIRGREREADGVYVAYVVDGEKIVHTTEPIYLSVDNSDDIYEISARSRDLAIEWLNENYPNWQDPGAYWD